MSNFIHIDHSNFSKATKAIGTYAENHKNKMTKAHEEVTTLGASWQGHDYIQFQIKWNELTEDNSVSQSMLSAMENYKKFLNYASAKYKKMQIDSVNMAKKISKNW